MAKAVEAEAFLAPFPSPPLTYGKASIEALYRALEADFPLRLGTGETIGGTSPATIAGSVVSSNATIIAQIVMAQLIRPGARVLILTSAHPLNMQSGIIDFGNIQQSLHRAAIIQYWRRTGLPLANQCGFTNSKSIDFQCGYERAIQAVITALAGAHIIQMPGCIYGELTLHPIQIVLDDDIANMVGRFLEGFEVSDETLAVDLINEVGPIPGMYLDKEHTRKWWKREQFIPKAADRLGIPEWIVKGKKMQSTMPRKGWKRY